jgi:hypothetical protein
LIRNPVVAWQWIPPRVCPCLHWGM